jgi:ribosome modulation factor
MTDWDRLIEETSKIHRDNMEDAYHRGYTWGLIEGKRQGNEEMLQLMKEKMEWTT